MHWWAVILIGAGVGFVAGLFGKGGSAIATPLLHAAGVPAFVAVAAPLPATIPSTMAASVPYWRLRMFNRRLIGWSVAFGVPATIAGALASRWVGGGALIVITDLVVIGIGLRSLIGRREIGPPVKVDDISVPRLAAVAVVVGLAAGLLANSGGFLLAPLYLAVLRLPIKQAFATSLVVSSLLAIPGTIVHIALGHIDWTVVVVFGLASIPLANAGARVAIRFDAGRLERFYGFGLVSLGAVMLAIR